jgi:hypothetical protein
VRFTCGNCGRAYVADDRIEGLAFKMPCRRCGQIISVGGASAPTPAPGHQPGVVAEPPRSAAALAASPAPPPAAEGNGPTAGKGRSALLVVMGVVTLAAAGGVAWYVKAPASRSAPPQGERPREAAIAATQAARLPPEGQPAPGSTPAPAASPPVEAPPGPAGPAAAAQAAPPAARPASGPADARRKAERQDARKPAPPPVAIPAAPPRSDLPPRDEQQIQATLARYAGSFDGCVTAARRDEPDLLATPRAVVVTMTVRPGGEALYPTLDDAQLSGTALGACVKGQSARMVFPESGGEPVRVTMPLVLGR